MISEQLLAEFRDWPARLAPELAGRVNIISQPAELPHSRTAAAYVVHLACPELANFVPDPSLHTIVFCRAMDRSEAFPLLLHELAHVLPASAEPIPVAKPGVFEKSTADLDRTVMLFPGWVEGDHGKQFVRISLHLWWRSALLGEFIPNLESLNCAGSFYDLSPAGLYWRGLGSEPVRMQHATFAEICATEPPEDFTTIWHGDLARWMDANPQKVKELRNGSSNGQ